MYTQPWDRFSVGDVTQQGDGVSDKQEENPDWNRSPNSSSGDLRARTHTCGLYMRPSPHVMYRAAWTPVFSIPVRFLLLSWSCDLRHMTASITPRLKVLQSLDWPRACYTSERVVTQTQTVTALETTNLPNNKARQLAAIVTSDSKQEHLGFIINSTRATWEFNSCARLPRCCFCGFSAADASMSHF